MSTHKSAKSTPKTSQSKGSGISFFARAEKFVRGTLFFAIVVIGSNALLHATNFDIQPLQPGIDPSFIFGYGEFLFRPEHVHNVFSTYGPFGLLVHALDVHNVLPGLVIVNVLFGVGVGWIIMRLMTNFSAGWGWLFAVGLSLIVAIQIFEWRFLAALLLLELYLYTKRRELAWFHIAILGVVAASMMFIKFSLGIAAGVGILVLASISWRDMSMTLRRAALFAAILLVGFLAVAALALRTIDPTDIYHYLRYGLEITSGYSAAMALAFDKWIVVATFLSVCAVAIVAFLLAAKKGERKIIWLVLPALFFVWKAAIVRQDPYGHVEAFAIFLIFVMLFLWLYLGISRRKIVTPYVSLPLIVAGSGLVMWAAFINGINAERLKSIISSPATFWRVERCTLAPCFPADSLPLPQSFTDRIGNKTVDVYPWNLSYIPANNLSWSSRPIFASYATYTPKLDNTNAAFFASAKAPAFIVWHHDQGVQSIDDRHLLFDEPATIRAILTNYEPVETHDQLTLLSKRDKTTGTNFEAMGASASVPWGEWIEIPPSEDRIYAELQYEPNMRQTAGGIFFRPTPVIINFMKESGVTQSFRVVAANLEQGIIVNDLPFTIEELRTLLQGQTLADRVKAIKIDGKPTGKLTVTLLKGL